LFPLQLPDYKANKKYNKY